ncbi:phytoene desaturase family protein [Actinoplanes sp. NBRC 103695]|uniref:phytoene desaturase family protein n=1 Tax=Actinoplanes sp. NBRC 103695 TaxID=3032202 RepID=UPI00255586EB|nr:phytoene desaturase family protein [Actinoplanes sp. NBRC 103695]
MRRVTGPTDRVVVVGAGLAGLSCALHLAAAGREVTVVEREPIPGGRAGRLTVDGYEFDTGPTVLTMPELIAEPLAAVGENLEDWLELTPLDPAYRAYYPDGSTLDVRTDTARMAAEVSRVCGPREADGYLRFVDYARKLWELERHAFIDKNLDTPLDLVNLNLLKLLGMGGFGRLQPKIDQFFRDPRTRRIFSFQAMYAGLAPHDALAIYAVIAYLDSVAGVFYPKGGMHAVPTALAGAAAKHGVHFRYGTTVASVGVYNGRATGVVTTDGEHIPADVVVLNPDLPVAHDLLPTPYRRRLRYSPSCVVLHVGSTAQYSKIAHHNIHFGAAWKGTFDEVIHRGELMSDPSLLVTHPTPDTYYVLAPTPNLQSAPLDWEQLGPAYADQLMAELERRGYIGFRDGVQTLRIVTPADWAAQGMAGGTPFAAAHTMTQTGPFRPGNMHPTLANVVFTGSGTQPGVGVPMVLISGKLAAARVTGA